MVVTITGTNDGPVVGTADLVGAVSEGNSTGALTDSGTIAFTDVDLTDVHSASAAFVSTSKAGGVQLGTLTANVSNVATGDGAGEVTWNFSVNDAAVQFLFVDDTTPTTIYTPPPHDAPPS